MKLKPFEVLHPKPSTQDFVTQNNRKLTLGRVSVAKRIQSVPIFQYTQIEGKKQSTFLGYRYIYH